MAHSFDGDGHQFRLISEAHRIRLAHLFDPVLAVHTSVVEPLPHQITAVYESMLPRQPLRFLLADDPGAGKTIMAGLLIKELIARGDPQRRDRLLLLNALAILLLTLLGAAGESLGMDRSLRTSTVKRRVHSLFRQGCQPYDLIPNMPERRLRPLVENYEEFENRT